MASGPGIPHKLCKVKSHEIKTSHHTNLHQKLGSPLFCSWKNRHFMGLCKSLQNFLNRTLLMDIGSYLSARLLVLTQESGKTGSLGGSCTLGIAAVSCLCHPWIWSTCFWSGSVEICTFVQIF